MDLFTGFFPASMEIDVFSLNGSLPGSSLFSETVTSAQFSSASATAFGTSVVTIDLTGLALSAGIFDISFYNPGQLFLPLYAGGSGLAVQSGSRYTGGYYHSDLSLGFELDDASTTPVPAALPLFATGLGVMGWFGRRRKRKNAAIAA